MATHTNLKSTEMKGIMKENKEKVLNLKAKNTIKFKRNFGTFTILQLIKT